MVAIASALGRTGFQEWFFQRVTAGIMVVYLLGLVIAICTQDSLDYQTWAQWFDYGGVKFATLLAILSVVVHAWIGFWTVTTDYVKPLILRLPLQLIVNTLLLFCVVWGIQILWG